MKNIFSVHSKNTRTFSTGHKQVHNCNKELFCDVQIYFSDDQINRYFYIRVRKKPGRISNFSGSNVCLML